jgi:hypothetical protein
MSTPKLNIVGLLGEVVAAVVVPVLLTGFGLFMLYAFYDAREEKQS